MSLPFSQTG